MSDSLVRVSRRADGTHFVSIFAQRVCSGHRRRSVQARGKQNGSPIDVWLRASLGRRRVALPGA